MAFSSNLMRDVKGYMTIEECYSVINAAGNPRDRLLMLIMFRCGRRVSEVLQLRHSDIMVSEKKAIFHILKKRRPLTEMRPVDDDTMREISVYQASHPHKADDLIFPVTRQWVFKAVRSAGRRAGVEFVGSKRIHPHHFRHSFAVYQVRNNLHTIEDLRMLQRYMGHSDIGQTAHYLQFSSDDMKKIVSVWK